MATFHIQQFGCRATQADGAAIERQLLGRGYNPASDPSAASIVVLNTCTVTAAADAQARDAIRKIHAQNPAAKLIVTGCYAQRAPEELATLPGVTWVVGNSHKPHIPALVTQIAPAANLRATREGPVYAANEQAVIPSEARLLRSDRFYGARNLPFPPAPANRNTPPASILTGDIFAHPEFLSAPVQGGELHHTRPILKIQDGCNLRCSYCIIPSVRGKSRSLAPDAVIHEIQSLVAQALLPVRSSPYQSIAVAQPILAVHSAAPQPPQCAAKEIVLSGINLGTYGRDLNPQITFLALLRRILDETHIEHLRISSIEPQGVTQDLIDLVATNDRLAQHIHMPLQSASNRVLAAMHRRYRIAHYAARLDRIQSLLPNAAIGADVIAGFPGETESDHSATLSFIEQSPFTYLHVFSYSSRPGTKAASAPDQIPTATIKRRARELRALSEQKSAAFRQSQVGRTLRVLTLRRDANEDRDGSTPALSTNYMRVQVPAVLPSNQWVEISIKYSEGNYISGEIVESDRQALRESSAHSSTLR